MPTRLALLTCAAACTTLPSSILARERPAIEVAEPEGFADLTGEREILIDLYFGGRLLGQTIIRVSPGWVELANAQAVAAMIPHVADRENLANLLARDRLSANSELACSLGADRDRCGRLTPEVVGLIYDREKFRIDIFLNPQLLIVPDPETERYLPSPDKDLSLISSFGAALSGQTGGAGQTHNLYNQITLAAGDKRAFADLSHSSSQGLSVESLAMEWDRPGLRYSAGAIWASGGLFAGRRKLLGAGIESQIDTRHDREDLLGAPIVVFLGQRARVEVLQNERILSFAIYEAGNRLIDTSNLPEGSYEVTLRIEEAGQQPRQERRAFSKFRTTPSLGRSDFFAFGGLLIERHGSLNPSNTPYLATGIVHRLSEQWAFGGNMEIVGQKVSAELAATFLTPGIQLRASTLARSDGSYGGALQISSASSGPLSYNLDLRKIERTGPLTIPTVATVAEEPLGEIGFPFSLGDYSQGGGTLSYSIANLRFLASAFFRDDEQEGLRYNVGPALEWDFLQRGHLSLTMRGEMAATDRGQSGFAGISLRLLTAKSSISSLVGISASGIRGDDRGDGPISALAGSWTHRLGDADIALGAGLERQPRRSSASLSTELRHPLGSFSGDLVHSDRSGRASTQYSVGFQSTLVMAEGATELVGESSTQSVIIARVDGARAEDSFEVLVNDSVAGKISGLRPLRLSLPAYRTYDVRVRPAGGGLLAYDNSTRRLSLYPGSVSRLIWQSKPIVLRIGRLMSANGAPIGNASIVGNGIWAETNVDGYFQVEAPENAMVTVTLGSGMSYLLNLPTSPSANGIARLGSVICCGKSDAKTGALARGK